MSKLSKINRKLKAAMKMFIKHEDVGALRSIAKLSKERQLALENLNNTEKTTEQ
tara:strand:+ start:824 stop:985 length:162 start_codon:yes stop_codon:yes gene_type:complete